MDQDTKKAMKDARLAVPRCKVFSVDGKELDPTDHRQARLMVKRGVAVRIDPSKTPIRMLRPVGDVTSVKRT